MLRIGLIYLIVGLLVGCSVHTTVDNLVPGLSAAESARVTSRHKTTLGGHCGYMSIPEGCRIAEVGCWARYQFPVVGVTVYPIETLLVATCDFKCTETGFAPDEDYFFLFNPKAGHDYAISHSRESGCVSLVDKSSDDLIEENCDPDRPKQLSRPCSEIVPDGYKTR